MKAREAQILQALARLLARPDLAVIPETTTATLARMAIESDKMGAIEEQLAPHYRDALVLAGRKPHGEATLREQAAALFDEIGTLPLSLEHVQAIRTIVRAERAYRARYHEEVMGMLRRGGATSGEAAASPSRKRDLLEVYLRSRIDPGISVVSFEPLQGTSERIALVTIAPNGKLPERLLFRQQKSRIVHSNPVTKEFEFLQAIAQLNLPAPKPEHLEHDKTDLGLPFALLTYLNGQRAGGFSLDEGIGQQFVLDVAELLAKMHREQPPRLVHARTNSVREGFLQKLTEYRDLWRANRLEPSPLVESAFAWLILQAQREMGPPVIVHGDMTPRNLLHVNGRLNGIIDWESAHIGFAGQDIGYWRNFMRDNPSWDEFVSRYRAAGGVGLEDRHLTMGLIWGNLRAIVHAVVRARDFHNGETNAFEYGAFAYVSLPRVETWLARHLEPAWAAETKVD